MSKYQKEKDRQIAYRKERHLINWNTPDNQAFIDVLMSANRPDLMRLFLDDLLTRSEIETFVRRLQTACLIMVGTPYRETTRLTGMSSKVIARISKSMVNKQGGFQVIIKKMHPRGLHFSD